MSDAADEDRADKAEREIERLRDALKEIRNRVNSAAAPGSIFMQIHRLVDNALAGKAVLRPLASAVKDGK